MMIPAAVAFSVFLQTRPDRFFQPLLFTSLIIPQIIDSALEQLIRGNLKKRAIAGIIETSGIAAPVSHLLTA